MGFFDFNGAACLHDGGVMFFAIVEEIAFIHLGGCTGAFGRLAGGGDFARCFAEEFLSRSLVEAAKLGIDEDKTALPVLVENTDGELVEEQLAQRIGVLPQFATRFSFPRGGLDCVGCIHGTFKARRVLRSRAFLYIGRAGAQL